MTVVAAQVAALRPICPAEDAELVLVVHVQVDV
jgi:hypothetical protein